MTLASLPADQVQAIRAAASWYACLSSGIASDVDRAGWQRWVDADPLHAQAWQRVESINAQLAGVPACLAAPVLRGAQSSRRQILRSVVLLASAGSLGWLGWRSESGQAWMADYRTAIGERRQVQLADGSVLWLNTNTAVNIRFDAGQRQIELRHGEIMVTTHPDPLQRPFSVATGQGQILALGTRFSVQAFSDRSDVAVLEKAVHITPRDNRSGLRLEAGQRVTFDALGWGAIRHNDASVGDWREGSMIAVDQPLGELLTQLSRYRPGILQCDPAIADLKISGAFPLDNTELALAALESGFSLKVRHFTRYWVRISR